MNREICSVCGSWLGDDELLALRAEVEALRRNGDGMVEEVRRLLDRAENAEAENAKLRKALSDIVRRYEFRSELYIDDATCAGSLYDTARLVLSKKEML